MILESAVEAGAAHIITFDKDLLSLKNYQDINIAHPSMVKYWFPKDTS
jgi:predicted nucleic acid-binding protein